MNKNMKKMIIIFLVLIIVVGGSSFYGGMKYEQSKNQNQARQFFQGNMGANFGANFQRRAGSGQNMVTGEVIAKDGQSITLKTPDGGSKIIFFSDSTKISKTTDGSINDIEIGKQIITNGSQNSDGSYTAQTIQER
jgi:hypothetical protein